MRGEAKPTRRQAETRKTKDLVRRLVTIARGQVDEELRPRNVTGAQLRFLAEVRQYPGGTGAQLARACFITPQSAQTMMALAVTRGWVVRGKDPENERLVTAWLTKAGEQLLAEAEPIRQRMEAQIWADISMVEIRQMNATLGRALANLKKSEPKPLPAANDSRR